MDVRSESNVIVRRLMFANLLELAGVTLTALTLVVDAVCARFVDFLEVFLAVVAMSRTIPLRITPSVTIVKQHVNHHEQVYNGFFLYMPHRVRS